MVSAPRRSRRSRRPKSSPRVGTGFLLAKLALHAYALDHPERPQPGNLQALVPSYLVEVPLGPGNERRLTLDDLRPEPETTQESPERH